MRLTATPEHTSDGLFDVLASRARATSDGALVIVVLGGLAAAIGVAVWRPAAWMVLGAVGVCAAAFGGWGIADRELVERAGTGSRAALAALRAVRLLALLAGIGAAIVAALRMLGAVLGTWIS
jgi:hypothetical protein